MDWGKPKTSTCPRRDPERAARRSGLEQPVELGLKSERSLVNWIGNDVVDLEHSSLHGKLESRRFLKRVFTKSEQAIIARAGESDIELWCLWACKEAAFKAFSKTLPTPPAFIHSAFEVSWTRVIQEESSCTRVGNVAYEGLAVSVSLDLSEAVLHAFAWTGHPNDTIQGALPAELYHDVARLEEPGTPWSAPYPELLEQLTSEERAGVHSRESAAARIGVKASIAKTFNLALDHLQVLRPRRSTGRSHPLLILGGKPSGIDISISHHGSWIGWAFLETDNDRRE